jgi:FlaG/FlaF family flagellin (archaellin)
MAALTTQNIARTGITPTYAAVAASDTFTPDAQTFIHVKNAGGSADSCVIQVLAGDPPGLTISDVTVSVTNAQERMIGPFPANFFADPTTGAATVTHSFTTSVTVGVFKLGQP